MRLLQLRSILLATDLHHGSDAAERTAVKLAVASGARLSVVHAVPDDMSNEDVRERLDRAQMIGAPDIRAHVRVVRGDPIDVVLREQGLVNADSVVLGPRRQNAPDPGPLGSVAYAVVRRALVPTLIVPRELELPLTHVMVAVDLSLGGRMALATAVTWATALRHPRGTAHRTKITALHVDLPEHPERLCDEDTVRLADEVDAVHRQALSWSDVDTRFECAEGKGVAETILEHQLATDVDLLVIGTRATPLTDNKIGSVSDTVTRWATRPVLLVPPEVASTRPLPRRARRSRLRA